MKRRYITVNNIGIVNKMATAVAIVMIPPRKIASTISLAMFVQLSNPQSCVLRSADASE
jgi:predicted RNA-binding protein with EMAP domain